MASYWEVVPDIDEEIIIESESTAADDCSAAKFHMVFDTIDSGRYWWTFESSPQWQTDVHPFEHRGDEFWEDWRVQMGGTWRYILVKSLLRKLTQGRNHYLNRLVSIVREP